jgi:hypothetical protein
MDLVPTARQLRYVLVWLLNEGKRGPIVFEATFPLRYQPFAPKIVFVWRFARLNPCGFYAASPTNPPTP